MPSIATCGSQRGAPGELEQEFKSARELQQVLIPETLPALPGFAMTSSYRPAQEVGGDFFQIIPLEGEFKGSTLILLGDVSGKGLRAAMTVSLIVGAVRALAKFAPHPAEILTELNRAAVWPHAGRFCNLPRAARRCGRALRHGQRGSSGTVSE